MLKPYTRGISLAIPAPWFANWVCYQIGHTIILISSEYQSPGTPLEHDSEIAIFYGSADTRNIDETQPTLSRSVRTVQHLHNYAAELNVLTQRTPCHTWFPYHKWAILHQSAPGSCLWESSSQEHLHRCHSLDFHNTRWLCQSFGFLARLEALHLEPQRGATQKHRLPIPQTFVPINSQSLLLDDSNRNWNCWQTPVISFDKLCAPSQQIPSPRTVPKESKVSWVPSPSCSPAKRYDLLELHKFSHIWDFP